MICFPFFSRGLRMQRYYRISEAGRREKGAADIHSGAKVRDIELGAFDEVERAIRALIKANRFIRQNRDGAIQVLMEWGMTGRENATATYDSTSRVFNLDGNIQQDGLRLVIDQAKLALKVTREVSPGEVSDVSLLREVDGVKSFLVTFIEPQFVPVSKVKMRPQSLK